MRILHALSQTEMTGSEAYAFDLVSYQLKAGHQTLTISDNFHLPFQGERQSISLSTNSFWQRMKNIWRLRQILRQKESSIDVIHCHSRGACRHLFWAALGLKIPILTTIHGYQHSSFSKRLFNIYGDYVLAVCEKIRDQMVRDLRTPPYAIEVLRNPTRCDAPFWKQKIYENKHTAASLTQGRRLLLAGRNSGPKGLRLRTLFSYLAKHREEIPTDVVVHLVLSGLDGKERDRLHQLWPEAQIDGHLPGLAPVLAASDWVVASGRIALEAMATGKRVYALGEATQPGFVCETNVSEILASNFGDVGQEENMNLDRILTELLNEMKVSTLQDQFQVAPSLMEEFDFSRVQDRILELYRGLRIFKRIPALPILMYHRIVEQELNTQHRTFVTREKFAEHLAFFRSRGFKSLSFSELADFWFEKRPLEQLPRRPIVLTFDDGYQNNLKRAQPLLEEYGFQAEIFLLANPHLVQNTWDPVEDPTRLEDSHRLMNLEEKRQLKAKVFHIGSHGFNHRKLPEVSTLEIREELVESKVRLEKDLGRPVTAFAYPYGAIDDRLPALARAAGYEFAVNTDQGPVYWFTNRWSLFRINIFPEETTTTLWKKTAPWYRRYYFRKRGR